MRPQDRPCLQGHPGCSEQAFQGTRGEGRHGRLSAPPDVSPVCLSTFDLSGCAVRGVGEEAPCLAAEAPRGVRGQEPHSLLGPSWDPAQVGRASPPVQGPQRGVGPTPGHLPAGQAEPRSGKPRPACPAGSLPHPAGPGIVLVPRAHAHRQHKRLPLPRLGGRLSRGLGPSIPGPLGLLGRWLRAGLGALPAEALGVLGPTFLLLLLAHLLAHLQDDARELVKVAEALNVGQVDAVPEVDLYRLLPSRDVGVTLRSQRAAVSRLRDRSLQPRSHLRPRALAQPSY